MARKGENRTGSDRSKLNRALERKSKPIVDREKNMRPKSGEEHSRRDKKRGW